MLTYILLTVQCKHRWNPLAVRYSSWIRYTVLPQVGEVVWSGQDYAVDLRPSPDLCGHGGTYQDPSRDTDHKAADLHVHHHSPVTHACPEPLHREKENPSKGTTTSVQGRLPDTPSSGAACKWKHTTPNLVCVHHHMFCLELWFCFVNVTLVMCLLLVWHTGVCQQGFLSVHI